MSHGVKNKHSSVSSVQQSALYHTVPDCTRLSGVRGYTLVFIIQSALYQTIWCQRVLNTLVFIIYFNFEPLDSSILHTHTNFKF